MQYKILIPARGGSKRIPRKNIIDLSGKPLISYSIEQALKISENVYVSTDDSDIARISEKYGANVLIRPPEISGDYSKTEDVVYHFLDNEDTDVLILLQATCPLIKSEYILNGIDLMNQYDSVISVIREIGFYWDTNGTPLNFILGNRSRTQDMDAWYKENGSFYITTKHLFKKTGLLSAGKVGFVEMPYANSIDIDTFEDLKLANSVLMHQSSSFVRFGD